MISALCCPSCKQEGISLQEGAKQGSARHFIIQCICGWRKVFWSSEKGSYGGFEVNKRTVYAARNSGIGYNGLVKCHAILNLPPTVTRNNYNTISKAKQGILIFQKHYL